MPKKNKLKYYIKLLRDLGLNTEDYYELADMLEKLDKVLKSLSSEKDIWYSNEIVAYIRMEMNK